MFNFEHKIYLLLLLILPVLAGMYLYYQFRRRKDLKKLGNPEVIGVLIPDYSSFRNNLKFILLLAAVSLIIIALAGPRFGSKLTQVKHEGVDVIVALDVSNSMLAEDIKPNRLERAKHELSRMLDRLQNDRIGLIVFAGEAYTQIPITNDYLSAKIFLSGINTQMISKQGTAIADAIDLGIRSFNPQSKAGKAIVIISDGENHEGGVEQACQKAVDKGIRIYTVGMGSEEGVRIPDPDNNSFSRDFKRDKDGNFIITRLNEQMLKDIARDGKGKYYRATSVDLGLNTLMADLNKLDKAGAELTEYSEYEQQFQGVLWIVLVLLVVEFVILGRKNKWLKNFKIFDVSRNSL
ncbi:MAG TPA: VWA domain-containing protein [Bacteroidales bacterium]|nr:VWA domain-containing protein [Bacteroidales bacterium]